MSGVFFAGVEAGGTSFCVAISEASDITKVIAKKVFPTTTPDETLSSIVEWLKQHKFHALGIASFGPVELDKTSQYYGHITTTPKPKWGMAPILKAFESFQVPIGFDTDVNAAAVSEHVIGNHGKGNRPIPSVAYITVGTGIGVGLVLGGKPVHGLVHPEGGHLIVGRCQGDENFVSTCPWHKACVEGFASIGALSARIGKPASELPNLPDDDIIWEICAHYLAVLSANLVLTVSPSVIVFGGGVMNRKCLYPLIRKKTLELLNGYINSPLLTPERIDEYIVSSPFGSESGIVGALTLAKVAYQQSQTSSV